MCQIYLHIYQFMPCFYFESPVVSSHLDAVLPVKYTSLFTGGAAVSLPVAGHTQTPLVTGLFCSLDDLQALGPHFWLTATPRKFSTC